MAQQASRRDPPVSAEVLRLQKLVAQQMAQQAAAQARRRSPDRKPIPPHRPVTPARLVRDVDIQLTIAVLDRVGIKPRGTPSGCDIVAEVMGQD